MRYKKHIFQGYQTDTNVSLSCEDGYHFEGETSSTEEKLQCDETGVWKVIKEDEDPDSYDLFDCEVHRCVRKFLFRLYSPCVVFVSCVRKYFCKFSSK